MMGKCLYSCKSKSKKQYLIKKLSLLIKIIFAIQNIRTYDELERLAIKNSILFKKFFPSNLSNRTLKYRTENVLFILIYN